jgi:hypothetical protein
MFCGSLDKCKSVDNYINWGMLEIDQLIPRHDAIVAEFKRRGWPSGSDHKTPVVQDYSNHPQFSTGKVHRERALLELVRRCPTCRSRYGVFQSQELLQKYGVVPVNSKWEGLMISWTNTTVDSDPLTFSDTLVKERQEMLLKLERRTLVTT